MIVEWVKRNGSSFLFILFLVFISPCNKAEKKSKLIEHTTNVQQVPISVKIIEPLENDNEIDITLLILINNFEWDELLLKEYKNYINVGYKIVFISSNWEELITKEALSVQQFYQTITNLFPDKNKNFFLISFGENISFSYLLQLETNFLSGVIYVNPSNKVYQSYPTIFTEKTNTPSLIIVTEDTTELNHSAEMLRSNINSLCEIRTYTNVDKIPLFCLAYSPFFEQIDLWIKTIINKDLN